jgi:very-short-patch-repair endonuclease
MKVAWTPLWKDMGWTPQGSVHEPEPDYLVESRERGEIHIKRSRDWTSERLAGVAATMEGIEKSCESPIEHQFGIAAAAVFGRLGLRVVPQYELSKYRYDFAILHPALDRVMALIECDGKEFHSTVQQSANDREKEAAASEMDTFVIRYSGAAIVRDPKDCAENALRHICWAWQLPLPPM